MLLVLELLESLSLHLMDFYLTSQKGVSSPLKPWSGESKSGKVKRPDLEWEGNRRKGEAYSGRKYAVVLCLGHL